MAEQKDKGAPCANCGHSREMHKLPKEQRSNIKFPLTKGGKERHQYSFRNCPGYRTGK